MITHRIDDLSLDEIMRRWPQTMRLFIDWQMHCVGCPIADFHRLADSAEEHGYALEDVRDAVLLAIRDGTISAAAPRSRRRSEGACAGP